MTLGDPLVNPQPQVLAINVLRWDADFLSQVECRPPFRRQRLALALGHGALHHLAIHVEADRLDVAVLLAPQQIPRPAQLQVERRDAEPRAQIAEFL